MTRWIILSILFSVLLLGLGLAAGWVFAPRLGEANCHNIYEEYLQRQQRDRGTIINPLRCRPDLLGGQKCSYDY